MDYKVQRDLRKVGIEAWDRGKEGHCRCTLKCTCVKPHHWTFLAAELIQSTMDPDWRKFSMREPSQDRGHHSAEVLRGWVGSCHLSIPRSIWGTARWGASEYHCSPMLGVSFLIWPRLRGLHCLRSVRTRNATEAHCYAIWNNLKQDMAWSLHKLLLQNICVHHKDVSLTKAPSDWRNKELNGQ